MSCCLNATLENDFQKAYRTLLRSLEKKNQTINEQVNWDHLFNEFNT